MLFKKEEMKIVKIINNIGLKILRKILLLLIIILFFLANKFKSRKIFTPTGKSSYDGLISKNGIKNLYESKKLIYVKVNNLLLKWAMTNNKISCENIITSKKVLNKNSGKNKINRLIKTSINKTQPNISYFLI